MRQLDMNKQCVFLHYVNDEEGLPNKVYLIQGTDDPVELEFLIEEREEIGEDEEGAIYQEVTEYLSTLGYIVIPIKSILLKEPWEPHMAHRLGEED